MRLTKQQKQKDKKREKNYNTHVYALSLMRKSLPRTRHKDQERSLLETSKQGLKSLEDLTVQFPLSCWFIAQGPWQERMLF